MMIRNENNVVNAAIDDDDATSADDDACLTVAKVIMLYGSLFVASLIKWSYVNHSLHKFTLYRHDELSIQTLTDSDQRVHKVRDSSEHDVVRLGAEISCQVRRQPLHYDVIGPVHTKVCYVDRPQRPVTYELDPARCAVRHLTHK